MTEWGDGTRCVHAGSTEPVAGQPFLAGPVLAAPYHLSPGHPGADDFYGRAGNPTWRALESAIGALDGGLCTVFPSGMAAITTLLRTLLSPGDLLVVPSDGYYLVRTFLTGLDVRVREVPTVGPWTAEAVAGARLVLLETPSNPGLDVCDIAAIAELAHAVGALVAVDNTTATPLGQRPLELGADVSVASDTKAVAGHSDVLFGHVSVTDEALWTELQRQRTVSGAIPGPFETWMVHRGLGTLDVRLARQAENAAALVAKLRGHEAVADVRWPGSPDDPSHAIASRQMRRFGGVFTFELASAELVTRFVRESRLVSAATSFGGLHSTADRRAHWGDPVPEGLVRFSAGLEDSHDLVHDVVDALDRAVGGPVQ
ncbi:cystathionine gamma-lyase [Kutzneria buriramensis]|uniref:Cystathionine gamma-lyase n=1 Tax=Kutzneria buriramensis TaxID=1045776 RepID=A0A3E0HAZ3_9PSEU|nr:cystathionine gamma-lyase [Kutzneria buriramensis]REH41205.1 cystathionine gamma-lyase [Kutzneria buriramensis]